MMSVKMMYDPVARSLHAVMAIMIIVLLAVGLYMEDLEPSPDKWQLYGVHKAVGMIALALIALRILWRATHAAPAPIATQKRWEVGLAKLVHLLLYVGMVMMPVSGYVMSSAGGHAISLFGMVNVPLLVPENKGLGEIAGEVHELAGFALIGAIALHFIGAMKHQIIDRDGTMARMFAFMRARSV